MRRSLIHRVTQAAAALLPAPATHPVQQRLFTGALFPEGVNEELRAFAARHGAESHVWVPVQAVENALRPYGIYILPNAALCDISLTTAGHTQDYAELSAALSDRVLVNASHTSNPHLLESFRERLVAVPPPPSGSGPASDLRAQRRTRVPHHPQPPSTVPLQFPRFQHPLMTDSMPVLHRSRCAKLLAEQTRHRYHSNYWFRTGPAQRFAYHNADETARPGIFNPTWCVNYTPHTITGQSFPKLIARLMRQRAVECGYVSRLWLTLPTAARCFDACLTDAHKADAPAIHTTFFTGGLECGTYYCADQFVCREPETALDAPLTGAMSALTAPRLRDIELAASGAAIERAKLRAFPLLWQLSSNSGSTPPGHELGTRGGADAAMHDATRHTRFVEATSRYKQIELLGDAYMANPSRTHHLLNVSGLGTALQRQCVLRGFPTPFFVTSRTLCDYNLTMLPGEEGFVQKTPVQLNGTLVHLDGECWFNVSQLEEPHIALRLFLQRPIHFLSRTPLSRAQALMCARLQDHVARGQDGCCEWLPQFVLAQTGWPLRPTAYALPMLGMREKPVSGSPASLWESPGGGAWFNLDDVVLPETDKAWLRTYAPVNRHGQPFLRSLRMVMTLRAFERGYQSPVWVCVEEEEQIIAHGQEPPPREAVTPLEGPAALTLRAAAAPVWPGRAVVADGALESPPFVVWSELHWVNAEELVQPLPTVAALPAERPEAAVGKGVSAESHTHWRMRRAEQAMERDELEDNDERDFPY